MKLFSVKDRITGSIVASFGDKMKAKSKRDELNGEPYTLDKSMRYHVAKGKEHKLYEIKHISGRHPKGKKKVK